MELFQVTTPRTSDMAPAPFAARYCPIFWEPLQGTGERVVALLAVQPKKEEQRSTLRAAAYPVLNEARLRKLFGRQRGTAAIGILRETADYMTGRLAAGVALEDLRPLFEGFMVGPTYVARAYSTQQLLDAAVRSVCALGSADDMIDEEEKTVVGRHTVRTHEFLVRLRSIFTSQDRALASRFDVPLRGRSGVPEVTIDYADGPLAVQVTSLPATERQARNAEQEAQAKLFEFDVAREQMDGNRFRPALLLNTDALAEHAGDAAHRYASEALDRLMQFTKFKKIELLQAANPGAAARLLDQTPA